MPKISVIIPTYNRSWLVKEAVESVLAQTFKNLEVIVVDDGSTDNTRDVIEVIDDKRIKYFYKENGGVSSARNLGMNEAKGEYIAFLDHDDFYPENFIEIMVAKLQENPNYGAVYCPIAILNPDGRRIRAYKAQYCKSGWITTDLFKKSFVWTSAAVFKKTAWKDLKFDESLKKSTEDFDAYLRLSVSTPFLFVNNIESFRRSLPDSLGHSKGITCYKPLVLERFYYKLGGRELIPKKVAKKKISHAYRKVAEAHRKAKNRKASFCLYKKAITYQPSDFRLYLGLIKALLLSKTNDKMLDWHMPEPLIANGLVLRRR